MTLYKHGVGFFERRASLTGEEASLSFRVEEMNDILKSLTAIDWGEGQVLGIDYATPQSREERLEGCSVRLRDKRNLRDLLGGLRGRRVSLQLDQGETAVGTLLGLDELPDRQPIGDSLVSLLQDEVEQVQNFPLSRVQSVDILDERGAADLRFFLQLAQTQEDYRQVTVRLTPGEHDLSVSYIAPAPTWRVSYRLVAAPEADGQPQVLLLGWGIFDNRLEEELTEISLSLVAGMPISFVYDLYTPFMPERPFIEEESRVAPGPVDLVAGAAVFSRMPEAEPEMMQAMAAAPAEPKKRERKMSATDIAESVSVSASGEAMGELFQYHITTPVSVGRGQSAMVPIVSTNLSYNKDLIYNSAKLAVHPIASLRLTNTTGLTLERGPATVIENGDYVGEAVLPFTAAGAEFIIPYAVELGMRVREQRGSRIELYGLSIQGDYLLFEEWDVRWHEYQLNNTTTKPMTILVEHPRTAHYDLFDTPKPAETTEESMRFAVDAPAKDETKLRVNTRTLHQRREEIRNQSYVNLSRYLQKGLIDQGTHDLIVEILKLVDKINDHNQRLSEIDKKRQKVYTAQRQIQDNMQALSTKGREGHVRNRYVDRLEATENSLSVLNKEEALLQQEIEQLEAEIEKKLKIKD
ncbi:MAG: hypothetical protein CSA11_08435 [Chloroflexi bacterium]|nr:MAG: hypothetical protein CSA11_08435 [Chloroflexota bacterium]